MKTGIFRDPPLESALKGAGFKVNGVKRKSGKTVITVERVIAKDTVRLCGEHKTIFSNREKE